jgi:LysM repeat protein
MSHKQGRGAQFAFLLAIALILIACNPTVSSSPVSSTFVAELEYFATATPFVSIPNGDATLDSQPQPSPTPITYTIIEGDTLLGVAERHGISLDNLLIANPGVDARFLSIGQELFIPLAGSPISENIEQASLPDLGLGDTNCLASVSGELWCFFLISNNTASAVENSVAEIELLDQNGQSLASAQAIGQIQKIDSGSRMPLVAYWSSVPAGWQQTSATLTSAFRLDDPLSRYADLSADILATDIAENALTAQISARLINSEPGTQISFRALAIAYSQDGLVVGVRSLEFEASALDFDIEVYSLGPLIATVEILVEARR